MTTPAHAQNICAGSTLSYSLQGNLGDEPITCAGLFACHPPTIGGQAVVVMPPGCDPEESTCSVTVSYPVTFPGLHQNFFPGATFGTVRLLAEGGGLIDECGNPGAPILADLGTASIAVDVHCPGGVGAPKFTLTGHLVSSNTRL